MATKLIVRTHSDASSVHKYLLLLRLWLLVVSAKTEVSAPAVMHGRRGKSSAEEHLEDVFR